MNFEENVCRQIPQLRRYAMSLTGDTVTAEDLVQDCLERALRKRHLWRRATSVRPWLFRMLYRIFLNHINSASTRREMAFADPARDLQVSANHEAQLQCRDAASAVERLPAEQRAALMLIVLENPSYEEAANILGIKVGTLRSRLSRARESVREYCRAPEDCSRQENISSKERATMSDRGVESDAAGREGTTVLRRVK